MPHFSVYSFFLTAFMPSRVQRKRTSSDLYGARKGSLSTGPASGTLRSHTPLRGSPPNRFPGICSTALWREIAKTEKKKSTLSSFLTLNNKGFTLLEILLAFFIFSILFVTIYASYSGSFKTINMTESRMELYRKAAVAMDRISEDLQASYISVLPLNSFGEPAGYTRFFGEDKEINGRNAGTMSFFSRIAPLFSDEMKTATGQLISYDVIQGDGEEELVLLRSENGEFINESEEKEGLTLCDGLQAITFTYFDDDGEPHESWDSDSEELQSTLPRMVSVSFEFLNYENPDATLTFMTSIALPSNYMPGLLNDVNDNTFSGTMRRGFKAISGTHHASNDGLNDAS